MTQPNAFGWYVDGALKRAINCVMRNPGELMAAPSMFSSLTIGPTSNTLHKLMPLESGHVYEFSRSGGGTWTITENGNAVTVGPLTSALSFSSTGRINPVRAKERMLVSSSNGILVGDNMAPTTAAERALRLAGLPQPNIGSLSPLLTTGGAIPAGVVVGYCALHTRTYADGYQLVSVPTPVVKQFNSFGGTINITTVISWYKNGSTAASAQVGDVIELYRTDGIAASSVLTDPPASMKLVASRTLTAGDIVAQAVSIEDKSVMDASPYYTTSGRALYSNPGLPGGATAINRQPPQAQCMCNYDGRVFYGNTTDRPRYTFNIPAGIGSAVTNLALQTSFWLTNGIGTRGLTGTSTLGSPTITGTSSTTGVVAGQFWFGSPLTFPSTARVLSKTANTVTMSTPALQNDGVWAVADAIEIDAGFGAQVYRIANLGDWMTSLAGLAPSGTGQTVEITSNRAISATPVLGDTYITGVNITIEPKTFVPATMSIRATNGQNYNPPLPELSTGTAQVFTKTELKTRLTWSKDQQPEHAAASNNETFVGLREIAAMASTKDAIWIACLDGTFRLSGFAGQYRLDQVDSTTIICAPQCMTTLNEDVYLYSNFGMLMLNSERRSNLTDMVIGNLLPGPQYAEVATMQLAANENDLELVFLDSSSKDRLWVYATKEGGGWTTLENNTKPGPLTNITALAFQRSPASGDPRLLVGVSPLAGVSPSYAGWGNTASFLTMDFAFQPIYADDPMSLKQWIEASFIFDTSCAGKSLRPSWNSTPIGSANIVLYQNAAYARAGIPRQHAIAQSISAGCDSITGAAPQARFQGISLMFKPLTQQAKQRQ